MSKTLRDELGFEIKEIEEPKDEANNFRVFFNNGTKRKASLEEVVLWSFLTAVRDENKRLREALEEIAKGEVTVDKDAEGMYLGPPYRVNDMSDRIEEIVIDALTDHKEEETNEKSV